MLATDHVVARRSTPDRTRSKVPSNPRSPSARPVLTIHVNRVYTGAALLTARVFSSQPGREEEE